MRLELNRNTLQDILRDCGDSWYNNVVRTSAEEFANRQGVADAVKAAIQTFLHASGFFELRNQDAVRDALNRRAVDACAKARLVGEVVACDVAPVMPEVGLLAQLAARAGVKQPGAGDRTYTDADLGRIVDYYLETLHQVELIKAESELARTEAERARVKAQEDIAEARTSLKIREMEQADRIAAREDDLQSDALKRRQAAQERNAAIMEQGAAYDFTYKRARLEEEMTLARKQLEIGQVKDEEERATRERRRLDIELELERERQLANVRVEERVGVMRGLSQVIDQLRNVPAPDYSGVRTLVQGRGEGAQDLQQTLIGLVGTLLSGSLEGAEGRFRDGASPVTGRKGGSG
jgi:hypothetical protein